MPGRGAVSSGRYPGEQLEEEEMYGRPYPPSMGPPYMGYDPNQGPAPYGMPPAPDMHMRRSGSSTPPHYEGRSSSPFAVLDKRQSRRVAQMPSLSQLSKREAPLYEDLINFPRAKDKDEMRCVMCGMPPGGGCVIPRQNKDVCKECDKATWQHNATGVFFKWCKGCKKFLKLASFSQKLDAAKCDKCRERGRQSYLMKKGRDGEDLPVRQHNTSSYHDASETGSHYGVPPPPMGPTTRQSLPRRARPSNFRHAVEGSDFESGDEEEEPRDDEDEEEEDGSPSRSRRGMHHEHHHHMGHHHMGHHHMGHMHGMPPHHMHHMHGSGGDEEDMDDEERIAADQALTAMRLSTNFGMPLTHLQHPGAGSSSHVGVSESLLGLAGGLPPALSVHPSSASVDGNASATGSQSPTAGVDHDNLRKLARIQEEVRQLEAQAAQVMVISQKLQEETHMRRKAEGRVKELLAENARLRAENERLQNELAYWQQEQPPTLVVPGSGFTEAGPYQQQPSGAGRGEPMSVSEYDGPNGEKRVRSDSINGAAVLLGGFKKQKVPAGPESYEHEEKVPVASAMMPGFSSTYEAPQPTPLTAPQDDTEGLDVAEDGAVRL